MPAAAAASTRRRRTLLSVGAAIALLLLAGGVAFSGGKDDHYSRARLLTEAQRARAPDWTVPCWALARWTGYSTCVRIAGRVVWRQGHDPDGDGDRHLFVVARLRVHLVKLPKELPVPMPRIGSHLEAIGWMLRGAHGRTELRAIRVVMDGTGHWGPPG